MTSAQKKAVRNYRSRLASRGVARFEVIGLGKDRELIRALARKLADDRPESQEVRSAVQRLVEGQTRPSTKGAILAALMQSPLVGSELDISHPHEDERRPIDL